MSSSDSVATQLRTLAGYYKHVCGNDLHVASHDHQKVIQHTHTYPHTHSLTELFYFLFAQHLPLFKHKFKCGMKVPNIIEQKRKSQACRKQTKAQRFEKPM